MQICYVECVYQGYKFLSVMKVCLCFRIVHRHIYMLEGNFNFSKVTAEEFLLKV